MVVNSEVLIALVFDKPALWDKRNLLYSNRNVIDNCWKDISLEMKEDENKLRKRWKYLRDQFAVELGKIPPSCSEDEALHPKWPYFKSLLFLKSVVKARSITGSTRRRSPSCSVDLDSQTNDNYFSPPTCNTEDDEYQAPVSPAMSTTNAPKRPRLMNIKNKKLKFLQEKRQNRTDTDNEHILFFKSLIPHIEKIPQDKILSFRSRIQSVVDEFAYGSSHNITGCSHFCNVTRRTSPETCDQQISPDNIVVDVSLVKLEDTEEK